MRCLSIAALALVLLSVCAYARPSTCTVHPTDPSADFSSLQEAIYKCGAGNTEIELIVGGILREGTVIVAPHLKYLVITSTERNLDLAGTPVIIGAFSAEYSADLWLEFSRVILDGGDYLPNVFYQKETGPITTLSGFHMLGCIVRRYTAPPFVNVNFANLKQRDFYVSNTAIVKKPEEVKHPAVNLEKSMSFPWSMNRAAGYAKADEGKHKPQE